VALGSLPGTSAHDYTGITQAESWNVPHLISALADHVISLNLGATLCNGGGNVIFRYDLPADCR